MEFVASVNEASVCSIISSQKMWLFPSSSLTKNSSNNHLRNLHVFAFCVVFQFGGRGALAQYRHLLIGTQTKAVVVQCNRSSCRRGLMSKWVESRLVPFQARARRWRVCPYKQNINIDFFVIIQIVYPNIRPS